MKYCDKCGKRLKDKEVCSCESKNLNSKTNKKSWNSNKTLAVILAVLIVIISGTIYGIKIHKDKKNTNDYLTKEIEKGDQTIDENPGEIEISDKDENLEEEQKDAEDSDEKPAEEEKDEKSEKEDEEQDESEKQDEKPSDELKGVDSELYKKIIGVWEYTGEGMREKEVYHVRISKTSLHSYFVSSDFGSELEIEKVEIDNKNNKVTLYGSSYETGLSEEDLQYYEEGTYEIIDGIEGMVNIRELNRVNIVELVDSTHINIYDSGNKSSYVYVYGLEDGM